MSALQSDETLTPDYKAIDAHLDRIDSGDVWVLTSVEETGGKTQTHTATFGPQRRAELHAWIGKQQAAERSVYVHYNPTKGRPKSKPGKNLVLALAWLFVDIDPAKPPEGCADVAAHYAAERERIRALCENLPSGIPRPTVCVFSGGGYQIAWRIKMPEMSDGTHDRIAELERYSRRLEEILGGDNCHNLDRMLRLAGTVNFPGTRKRAAGRVPVMSELCWADGPIVELGQFEKAEPKSAAGSAALSDEGEVALEAGATSHETLDDIMQLKGRKYDLCRVAIAQGCDPDDPGRWTDGGEGSISVGLLCGAVWNGDRSDAMWYVVCELVRADVDDPTIRGFLLDPAWGISSHVLAQSDPEDYADRQIRKAREAEGHPVARPTIYTNLGEVAEVVDQAQDALVRSGVRMFKRGTELVRLVKYGSLSSASGDDDVRRAEESVVIYPVSAMWLVDQMSRAARWRKRGEKDDSPSNPQVQHGLLLLARAGSWPFPTLRGIVTAPTLRADGSILQVPGYDAASGLIFSPGGMTFPPVPDRPTREDAVAALALFAPLFAGFPFVDDAARSVVLSAILSGLVRTSLGAIPLHGFDAPTAGTGKTMLAEVVGIIVTGNEPASFSQGKEEGEDEKRIGAALRAGDACFLIDNCERAVGGDLICSVITQRTVSIRILGLSQNIVLPCDVLVMATGNGLQIHGDMARRTVMCHLDSKVERPERREFDFDPRDRARERRAELVVAALTVLRAYVVAEGIQKPSPVGSFEDWNRRVRGALQWCGAGDPAGTMARLVEENEGGSELGAILRRWWEAFGDSQPHAADLKDDEELTGLLIEATKRPVWSTKSVGWYLRRNAKKIVGGLVLRKLDGDEHGATWQVTRTDGRNSEHEPEVDRKEREERDVLG